VVTKSQVILVSQLPLLLLHREVDSYVQGPKYAVRNSRATKAFKHVFFVWPPGKEICLLALAACNVAFLDKPCCINRRGNKMKIV